ncbi:hypothetical protein C8C77_103227 [Halanaerobium saccharolyticum]|uniref:Uncharacterized protein n=1 Tax=Halanaerobium saccharolyticum TaxID=43595 RepID=A0A4R7Z8L7_9FIRM|nr:hypothetical protein [Halanaerobium saccharolyticum]RAK11239.1 hypothetical protein C7958_103227 [Halanaerobium saccharolyticum]TDW07090.1 hypothetical protein C8C77_103227 [Halanaerobium saccharolyticum]TDX63855.1 hypothetical protein C7956_102227 [Halanaerobium saccharolyticum]
MTLDHPYNLTSVTEAYPPNVELCKNKLSPFGIEVKQVFDDNNFFEQVLFETYPVDISYSADEYIQLLNTYSPTISMETEERKKFLNEIKELINKKFDGIIEKNFAMSLTILRKRCDYN